MLRIYSFVLMALSTLTGVATASDIRTTPTRVILDVNQKAGALTVRNEDARKAVMQVEVMKWSQDGVEDRYEPSRDLLANPVIFEVAPGAEQVIRIGLQVGEDARERAYRIFLQEVPAKDDTRTGATALLRIGIPVFVPPMREDHVLKWTVKPAARGKLSVTVLNEGSIHSEIINLRIVDHQGQVLSKEEILSYVLPGQKRTWEIATTATFQSRQAVQLEALTDFQEMRAQLELEPLPPANGRK